jgi:glycosyltransferase involved in cell wall biosynthesis
MPLTACVITPSIGSRYLPECVASVAAQTYSHLEHYVICDGPAAHSRVAEAIDKGRLRRDRLHVVALPHNTGQERFHGYRICAGFSYLVPSDIVFFLDDDNWYDADHVASCMEAIELLTCDWAFACRRLCREDRQHLLDDDCDSLGFWRRDASYLGPADNLAQEFVDLYALDPFLVDTSCLVVRTSKLMTLAPLLVALKRGDSHISSYLVRNEPGACVGRRTVNYRVRDENLTRTVDYFRRGNTSNAARYLGANPWLSRQRCESLKSRQS